MNHFQLSLSEITFMWKSIHTLRHLHRFIPASLEVKLTSIVTSQNEKTTLLGKTKQDYASILKWLSFANSELLGKISEWFGPLVGGAPYNKKNVDEAQKATLARVKVIEDYLLVNTYLVGERISLADIFVHALLLRGFQKVFDKKFRDEHPNLVRWYETIAAQPFYSEVLPKVDFIAEAVKYTPPKKEAAPKKEVPVREAKPKAKEVDDEEEEDKPAPKPKHPLDLLPRSTFVLDDWKRKYSNEETPVSMKWFWENMNFEEFSIWRVDYKYNEELTMTFMSSNLIGTLLLSLLTSD
jgi:elongation factor 1-gamma